jgi:hypothetical protein
MRAGTIAFGAALVGPILFGSPAAEAHKLWGDGSPVSESVKKQCCGDADAHPLPPGSVHAMADGRHIDGFAKTVPYGAELPSPDGEDWGFWSDHRYTDGYKMLGYQSEMYCLFLTPRSL